MTRPVVAMVSDRHRCTDTNAEGACTALVIAAERAASAGVDLIQIRERGLEDRQLLALVERVRGAAEGSVSRVVVNDRLDVALAARAAGVHLPGRAMPAVRVRSIVPGGFLIGRSVHSQGEAVEVERGGGCDYLLFGSVFASASKAPGHPVAGLEALARVCASVRLPVLAIGGITLARVPEVARTGAAGIAAVGLFATGGELALADAIRYIKAAFA